MCVVESDFSFHAAVGALTGWTRDEWAKARGELESDPRNKDLLETVDSALFAITLDESHPKDHEEIMKTMLHGDCRDRWFDKSFNIVICADGRAGKLCIDFVNSCCSITLQVLYGLLSPQASLGNTHGVME